MLARKMVVAVLLATGMGGLAWAADGEKKVEQKRIVEKHVVHRAMGHSSVEFAAMHNIMAELLSAKTGKTQAEIAALFDAGGPHEVVETLNLSEEDMRATFKEARGTLITRAAAAKLITPEQAEKLRAAKVEMRHKRRMHDEDDED
jgi:hypothetical protein